MTVAELIYKLEAFDPEATVVAFNNFQGWDLTSVSLTAEYVVPTVELGLSLSSREDQQELEEYA